mgnify:CR=1 FL=1
MYVRLTNNDQEVERILGQRKSRASKYNAQVLFWVGLVLNSCFWCRDNFMPYNFGNKY